MREEVRRFRAVAKDGTEHTVVEWQRYTEWQPLSGPKTRAPGSKYFTLLNGESVSRIDDTAYRIFQTDEIIRAE